MRVLEGRFTTRALDVSKARVERQGLQSAEDIDFSGSLCDPAGMKQEMERRSSPDSACSALMLVGG